MKSVTFIFLFSIITLTCICQDSTISLSKFETFSSQPGKILKTESIQIGSVGQWMIAALKTTDVTAGNNAQAIKISYDDYYNNNIGLIVNPGTIYIDMDELDAVISFLTYFVKEASTLRAVQDLYYSWITSTDVMVFCYCMKGSDNWQFGLGKLYQKLRSHVPGTFITFNKKRVAQLLNLLSNAKTIKM